VCVVCALCRVKDRKCFYLKVQHDAVPEPVDQCSLGPSSWMCWSRVGRVKGRKDGGRGRQGDKKEKTSALPFQAVIISTQL